MQQESAARGETISNLNQQIATLQNQLDERVAAATSQAESYAALQQQSSAQGETIAALQQQLEQQSAAAIAQQETYSNLQQQSAAQLEKIADLNQQIAVLKNQLQQQSSAEAEAIATLHQQIADLQNKLNEQSHAHKALTENNELLKQELAKYAQRIIDLGQHVTEQNSVAAIGEAYLNKWRYRNFSS